MLRAADVVVRSHITPLTDDQVARPYLAVRQIAGPLRGIVFSGFRGMEQRALAASNDSLNSLRCDAERSEEHTSELQSH